MKILGKSDDKSPRKRSTLVNPSNPGSGTHSRIARELEVNCELGSDSDGFEFESKADWLFELNADHVRFWKKWRV